MATSTASAPGVSRTRAEDQHRRPRRARSRRRRRRRSARPAGGAARTRKASTTTAVPSAGRISAGPSTPTTTAAMRGRDRDLSAPRLAAERPPEPLGARVGEEHDQQRRQPARDRRETPAAPADRGARRACASAATLAISSRISAAAPCAPMRLSRMISSMRARSPRPPPSASNTSAKPSRCRPPVSAASSAASSTATSHGASAARERGGEPGEREPQHQPDERKEADRAPEIDVAQRPAPDRQPRQERERRHDGLHAGRPPRRGPGEAAAPPPSPPGRARRPRPRALVRRPVRSRNTRPSGVSGTRPMPTSLLTITTCDRRRASTASSAPIRSWTASAVAPPTSRFEIQIVRQSTRMTSWSRSASIASGSARGSSTRVEAGAGALGAVAGDAVAHLVVGALGGRDEEPARARAPARAPARSGSSPSAPRRRSGSGAAARRRRRVMRRSAPEPRQVGDDDHDRDARAADQPLVLVAEEQPVLDGAVLGAERRPDRSARARPRRRSRWNADRTPGAGCWA